MDNFGNWKQRILLAILALSGLVAIAGSSADIPVVPEQERQKPVSEVFEATEPQRTQSVETPDAPSARPELVERRPTSEPYETESGQAVAAVDASITPPVPARDRHPVPKSEESSQPTPPAKPITPAPPSPKVQAEAASKPSPEDAAEKTTESDPQSKSTISGTDGGTEQTEYTWEDGDRTLTVILQSDLVIDEDTTKKDTLANAPGGAIVKSADVDSKTRDQGLPVFKSQSGALMTLPGGVLLVLDQKWDEMEVNAFFVANSITKDKLEALSYVDNGYFIETDPGFPSLNLANTLAEREGVILSSPNWWTEVTLK